MTRTRALLVATMAGCGGAPTTEPARPPPPMIAPPPALTGTWQWANPLPQGDALFSVWGDGRAHVVAVGAFGAFVASDDDGRTWSVRPRLADVALYAVRGDAAGTLYVAGAAGTLLMSSPGGAPPFRRVALDTQGNLEPIRIEGDAVCVGDGQVDRPRVAHCSHDRGAHWDPPLSGEAANQVLDGWESPRTGTLLFPRDVPGKCQLVRRPRGGSESAHVLPQCFGLIGDAAGTVYAWGDRSYAYGVSASVDDGLTWHDVPFTTVEKGFTSRAAAVAEDGAVVVVGDGGVKISPDGRSPFVLPFRSEDGPLPRTRDVWAGPGGELVVVGLNGLILRRERGELSFHEVSQGVREPVMALRGRDAGELVSVGAAETILRSTDDGRTWTPSLGGRASDVARPTLHGVAVANDGRWLAVGDKGLALESADGSTWTERTASDRDLVAVAATTDGEWISEGTWTWAEKHATDAAVVHRSSGRGAAWSPVLSAPALSFDTTDLEDGFDCDSLGTLAGDGAGHLYALGHPRGAPLPAVVLYSADDGRTWGPLSALEGMRARGVATDGVGGVFVVGEEGRVACSTDGGRTWHYPESGTRLPLRGVVADRGGVVVAVGGRFNDKDGGTNHSGGSWDLHGASVVVHSLDRGRTWRVDDVPSNAPLLTVWRTSTGAVLAGGYGGTILRLAAGGR